MRRNKKNYRIKNLLSNQKGMALLTTLIFVFILVTLYNEIQRELYFWQMLVLKKLYGI